MSATILNFIGSKKPTPVMAPEVRQGIIDGIRAENLTRDELEQFKLAILVMGHPDVAECVDVIIEGLPS